MNATNGTNGSSVSAMRALAQVADDGEPTIAEPAGDLTPAQRSVGHLRLLREAFVHLMGQYREAWDGDADSVPETYPRRPEQATAAGIGLRPAGVTGPGDDPLDGALPLFGELGLSRSAETVLAAAWWAVADPQLASAFGWVHDDPARRYPTLAALRLLLEPYGMQVPLALPADSGPVALGLLAPMADAAAPARLTATAGLLMDGWRPPPEISTALPGRLRPAADEACALIRAGHRVGLRCADLDDGPVLARAVAARLGRALDDGRTRPAAETRLLERLGLVLPWTSDSSQSTSSAASASEGGEVADTALLRVTGPGVGSPPGWQVLDVAAIDPAGVTRAWRLALGQSGLDTSAAGQLAARMRLTEATVAQLHETARAAARVQRRHLTVADLHTAVRRHPQHRLGDLTRLVPPAHRLDDLVLPPTTRAGLLDVLAHARHSHEALAALPSGGVRGRGVVALLHGPSGTGKTAATEALAAELDRDLWLVDLAQVVSKWLGETSRNLDRLLTEAGRAGAVLLFDEAEGLFGRRAEVNDARDRYANLEIDHLLQRIELHEGLVVLTSNRPAALDDGFGRRLRLTVRFELPDHLAREQVWARLLPDGRLADPDARPLTQVAAAELSPSSIRSAALAALVFAADDGRAAVTEVDLHRAVRRELEKSGRGWPAYREAYRETNRDTNREAYRGAAR
ncbi:ATP-binding protein [Actinopolymorpha sp. NPDC004070]|uniref:AAA family ATPase n=1 Tax=Actinopolymorpha sp. NPDC004070 TaxID=3154548 RepID=UPI0033ACE68A